MANFTAISGSNVTDIKGTKLANGVISFLGTDNMDQPISFQIGGGGQALKRPITSPVIAGVITSFSVPDPANTLPTGIFYRVTVTDSATGLEVLRYTLVSFTGTTFNFDNYFPTGVTAGAPLTGTSVTGNLGVTGNIAATGTVTGSNIAGGQIATGIGTTNKVPKYTNGPSAVIGDSSISDDGTNVSTAEPVRVGSGTVAAPGLAFNSSTGTGFWRQAADVIGVSIAGVLEWLANAAGLLFSSADSIGWSSNADPSAAGGDVFVNRQAANKLGIGITAGAKDGILLLSKVAAGGTEGSGSVAGDITAARSATSGALFIGTDGAGQLFRSGDSLSLAGTTKTWTFPATTDTLSGKATTDIFTNKTYDTAGSGNVFKINGTSITDKTGTGKAVLDTAPTVAGLIDTGTTQAKRVRASQGSSLVSGDFAFAAGWGSTAALSAITGSDQGFTVTITANGSGIAANPTLTLTFHDGTWTNPPFFVICRGDGNGPATGFWIINSISATVLTMQFVGTPVSGSAYIVYAVGMGR